MCWAGCVSKDPHGGQGAGGDDPVERKMKSGGVAGAGEVSVPQCTLQFVREESEEDTGDAGGERTHQLAAQCGIMGWAEGAEE